MHADPSEPTLQEAITVICQDSMNAHSVPVYLTL